MDNIVQTLLGWGLCNKVHYKELYLPREEVEGEPQLLHHGSCTTASDGLCKSQAPCFACSMSSWQLQPKQVVSSAQPQSVTHVGNPNTTLLVS